ncbi:MAG: hypothetical protein ABIS67_09345 [Candidatus Eisenbacteria bacterium]
MLPLLLITRGVLWWYQPFAGEDAYITFRYAGELASGHGLVYNAGERVMGFTSLPWTLWCALGIALQIDPVGWTRSAGLAADLLSLILGTRMLGAAAGRGAAWAFAAFFATWPLFAAGSISGMETSVFLASLLGAAALVERRSVAAGPALALVALIRPEGVAAGLVLAFGARWRDRMVALAIVALAATGLAIYYGSPIPQSVWAKSSLYGTPGAWAGRHWWEWLLPFPLGRYPSATEGVQMLPIAAVFAASLAAGARFLWQARGATAARAAAAGIVVWLGYSAVGVAYFWWYMVVPVAALAMVAATGLPRIVRGAWLPVAAASLLAGTWTVAPALYLGRAQAESRLFAQVAEYLYGHAEAGQSVFLEPIGMIGFRCPIRVVDEVGLVSPAVARRRLQGPGWYADVAAAEKPDWLVVRRDFIGSGVAFAGAGAAFRTPAEREALLARYREIPAAEFGGGTLAIFRRLPAAE